MTAFNVTLLTAGVSVVSEKNNVGKNLNATSPNNLTFIKQSQVIKNAASNSTTSIVKLIGLSRLVNSITVNLTLLKLSLSRLLSYISLNITSPVLKTVNKFVNTNSPSIPIIVKLCTKLFSIVSATNNSIGKSWQTVLFTSANSICNLVRSFIITPITLAIAVSVNSISRSTGKILKITSVTTNSVNKYLAKAILGISITSGLILKTFLKTFNNTSITVGGLLRQFNWVRTYIATTNSITTIYKQKIFTLLATTVTIAGRILFVNKILSIASTSLVNFTKTFIKIFNVISLTSSSFAKNLVKYIVVLVSSICNIPKSYPKTFFPVSATVTILTRGISPIIRVTTSSVITVIKQIGKLLPISSFSYALELRGPHTGSVYNLSRVLYVTSSGIVNVNKGLFKLLSSITGNIVSLIRNWGV